MERIGKSILDASRKAIPNTTEIELSLPLFVKLRMHWEKKEGRKLADEELRERIRVHLRDKKTTRR